MNEQPATQLDRQWIMAGLVAASARFVPIPFADEMLKTRAAKYVVTRTLSAHKLNYPAKEISAIYESGQGILSGCIFSLLLFPVKLLLFPIRKMLAVVRSVRGVPNDLMRTILIGRTLDRCLLQGILPKTVSLESSQLRSLQAARIRFAFDQAFKGLDWLALRSALSDALEQANFWGRTWLNLATKARKSKSELEDIPVDDQEKQSAECVERALKRPEILALLSNFDQRFDSAMKTLLEEQVPS